MANTTYNRGSDTVVIHVSIDEARVLRYALRFFAEHDAMQHDPGGRAMASGMRELGDSVERAFKHGERVRSDRFAD